MKVLIVSSKANNKLSPFVKEQVDSLELAGVNCSFFFIKEGGLKGYLKSYKLLRKAIKTIKPDIIHAHYGLAGLLANIQRRIPVVTTFHGSDVNQKKTRKLSRIAAYLSSRSIYVSTKLRSAAKDSSGKVIPCGVDFSIFVPSDKEDAKKRMNLDPKKNYILFASSFDNKVKNSGLAIKAVQRVNDQLNFDLELLELKGCSREEVALLLNAAQCLIMTSFSEGSPQVIKEALATNTPIVSTDVGSVKEMISEVQGCVVVEQDVDAAVVGIKHCLEFSRDNGKTKGRAKAEELNLGLKQVAEQLRALYLDILNT